MPSLSINRTQSLLSAWSKNLDPSIVIEGNLNLRRRSRIHLVPCAVIRSAHASMPASHEMHVHGSRKEPNGAQPAIPAGDLEERARTERPCWLHSAPDARFSLAGSTASR